MTYKLLFLPSALKEWNKLGSTVREQFKKKLKERLTNPIIPGDRLSGQKNFYKIKLRNSVYRLVYEVEKKEVKVFVIAIGKRDNGLVYKKALKRRKQ
ncbi:MAG: type II toxin-antitoxin system RelE/ParE family toxin [Opitutales bacterium]|nr:type II toxin-antitoxin system RelE/ParE family toxin [Opitutales bacterium]